MVKQQPNYKLHALYAMTLAFIIVFGLHIMAGKISLNDTSQSEGTLRNTFRADNTGEALKSWLVIGLVLVSMATFNSTAPLAAAFAWLILISVILINTDRLLAIFDSASTGGGAGGKRAKK